MSKAKLSISQLERIGIYSVGTKLKPMYVIGNLGEFRIPDYYDMDDIYKMIYDQGYSNGIERGKFEKSREIKDALGIENSTNE